MEPGGNIIYNAIHSTDISHFQRNEIWDVVSDVSGW